MLTTVRAVRPLEEARPGPEVGLALRLLVQALEVADLLVRDVLLPAAAAPDAPDQLKEIAEVGMLLRAAARVEDREVRARVDALAALISPLARGDVVRRQLLARVSDAAPRTLAHGCLTQAGCPDPAFDREVRRALSASTAKAAERVPYRLLDSAWIRHLTLGDAELIEHPSLPLTCLGVGVDLVGVSVEAAYALSHTLPYATDFGRLSLPGWVDRQRQSELADGLIAKALAEEDMDLLGELLMAPALLRLPWSPMQRFGFRVLTDVWRRHPILPGPGVPPAAPGEDDQARKRRVLGTVYHTSLVGGLLMALLLWRDEVPHAISAELPPTTSGPAWRASWQGLSAAQRAEYAVAPWLIAMHGAMEAIDVGAMIALLRDPTAAAAPVEVVTQAAELIGRLISALDGAAAYPG
ncbi:MAG: hypothetical protein WAW88_06075 [Nocardioides sp.]